MAAWGSLCPRIPTGTPQLPLPVSASDRKLSEHGENKGLPQEMWNHHPWTSLKRPGHGTQCHGLAAEEVLGHRLDLTTSNHSGILWSPLMRTIPHPATRADGTNCQQRLL